MIGIYRARINLGAEQKEGAYGKFLVWPEEIVDSILK